MENNVALPWLARYQDAALLGLRLMVAIIFATSGWHDLTEPAARAADMGVSFGFALFLGAAELLGALGIAFGVLAQAAALGLILIMLGAIQKKIFVWHTGFWGDASAGWHYDLTMIVMNLVIATTGGGRWRLWK